MLIDNKDKAVGLIADSILFGDIILTEINTDWKFDDKERKLFKTQLEKWVTLRNGKSDNEEYKKLTDYIFQVFLDFRIVNLVVGKLRDRDSEQENEKLHNENLQLAKELGRAYIPPKDHKVGTT